MNRRSFLKKASLGAAALAVVPLSVLTSKASMPSALQPINKMRYINYVKRTIEPILKQFVFEPADEFTLMHVNYMVETLIMSIDGKNTVHSKFIGNDNDISIDVYLAEINTTLNWTLTHQAVNFLDIEPLDAEPWYAPAGMKRGLINATMLYS